MKIEFQKEFVNEDCNNYSTGQFSSEKSILHTAIEFNMIEVVRLLLQTENIDVNSRSFLKSYQYYLGVPGFEIEEKELVEKTPLYLAVDNENHNSFKSNRNWRFCFQRMFIINQKNNSFFCDKNWRLCFRRMFIIERNRNSFFCNKN